MPELTKQELNRFLPHAGSMCLLDTVEGWDGSSISCRATSHRDPENPLRHMGRLEIVSGLEYAAQAMGVHVGLLNPDRPTQGLIGYVGGIRDVTFGVERLDDLPADLNVETRRVFDGQDSFMYQFTLTAGDRVVLTGRASIFLKRVES